METRLSRAELEPMAKFVNTPRFHRGKFVTRQDSGIRNGLLFFHPSVVQMVVFNDEMFFATFFRFLCDKNNQKSLEITKN
jgi:hypothetical protein